MQAPRSASSRSAFRRGCRRASARNRGFPPRRYIPFAHRDWRRRPRSPCRDLAAYSLFGGQSLGLLEKSCRGALSPRNATRVDHSFRFRRRAAHWRVSRSNVTVDTRADRSKAPSTIRSPRAAAASEFSQNFRAADAVSGCRKLTEPSAATVSTRASWGTGVLDDVALCTQRPNFEARHQLPPDYRDTRLNSGIAAATPNVAAAKDCREHPEASPIERLVFDARCL